MSPELVLVDPALAELARSQLADPDDTVARLEALARESAIMAAARRLAELDSLAGQERGAFRLRDRSRRRRPVLAIGFATATLTLALVLGMSARPGGGPTAVETSAVETVPALAAPAFTPPAPAPPTVAAPAFTPPAPAPPADKPSRPRNRTPAVSRPVARPFAWSPSPGASAYHVELFRGAEKVFAAQTKKPAIDIPARWQFAGRSRTLGPGTYRWYVWPVVDGKRSAAATVQATLAFD